MKFQFLILSLFSLYFETARASFSIDLKLFTKQIKENPISLTESQDLTLINGFCTNCSNVLITHGFQADSNSAWIKSLKNELFKYDENLNIFVLDWSNGSITKYNEYELAIKNINTTVRQCSNMLTSFANKKYLNIKNNLLDMHCIGHSLGSHVCGITGSLMKINNYKFRRITGLDPAGPCFDAYDNSNRLSIDDADYVDVIHTSKTFGFRNALGHADFYPNDGTQQPGCYGKDADTINVRRSPVSLLLCGQEVDFGIEDNIVDDISNTSNTRISRAIDTNILFICSHSRAYTYFVESFSNKCDFVANQCDSWNKFQLQLCSKCQTNIMGYESFKPKIPTYYYLRTNKESPHCVPDSSPSLISTVSDQAFCSNSANILQLSYLIFFTIFIIFYYI